MQNVDRLYSTRLILDNFLAVIKIIQLCQINLISYHYLTRLARMVRMKLHIFLQLFIGKKILHFKRALPIKSF
jgi:hypothetical protein